MIDLAAARETFEGSTDLTVGIEEEFALIDPETLLLVPRFETLRDAGQADGAGRVDRRRADRLRDRDPLGRAARTSRTRRARQADAAGGCSRSPPRTASRSASTGTHPLSDYREQHIIDTEHYHRVEDGLKYVAWRNNTFSVHVHVGVQRRRPRRPGVRPAAADPADAAGDQRQLAYVDGIDSGLHTARTQTFTKSFPRCGIPDAFGSWARVGGLRRAARAHGLDRRVHPAVVVGAPAPRLRHRRGAHLRRPDDRRRVRRAGGADRRLRARRRGARSTRGRRRPTCPGRLIEENMWRAIRYGLDGRLLDLEARADRGVPRRGGARPPAARGPARTSSCPSSTARSASAAMIDAGATPAEVYAECVRETQATYSSRRPSR